MTRHPYRSALALCLFGIALPSLGQGTPKKKGPTVEELQQKIIDLQQKLIECQNPVKATAPNPMKDALEAFQTFNSTVNTGLNQSAYKEALIPLKVIVDKLPDNEQTAPLKKTLDMLVDAGNLWNISITRNEDYKGSGVPSVYVEDYLKKYKDEWKTITFSRWAYEGQSGNCIFGKDVLASCVKELAMDLMTKGQHNIKGFPKP